MRSVHLINLGCPKNQVDGEEMLGRLASEGWAVSSCPDGADLIVVNTCTFIASATEEALGAIDEALEHKRAHPSTRVVVAGCLPQRYGAALRKELPRVDAFLGIEAAEHVVGFVEAVMRGVGVCEVPQPSRVAARPSPRLRSGHKHYAYVKIADGCDHRCTYCVIPDVRGAYRSRRLDDIVKETRSLVEDDAKEIVLVAQDTTRYGSDLSDGTRLSSLLSSLDRVDGVGWIRVMYAHPDRVARDLVSAFRDIERVVPYVDLPVQHLSASVLRRMGRGHSPGRIRDVLGALRSAVPGIAVRTTVLVGFPGETDQDFALLLDGLRELRFERLGTFGFSAEEGTPASRLPDQLPSGLIAERLDAVMRLQRELHVERNGAQVGRVRDVIVDGPSGDGTAGVLARTTDDAPEVDCAVKLPGVSPSPGSFVKARVVGTDGYDLLGEVVI